MFEKVNPSHPDKVADRIAGAVVDLCYKESENPKVACEVLVGHGCCYAQIETSERVKQWQVAEIAERITGDTNICVVANIVPQDLYLAENQRKGIRCGDNGIFRGCPVSEEQRKLAEMAAIIYKQHPSDGKYILNGDKAIICQSNVQGEELATIAKEFASNITINPLGSWTGGIDADSGATNRKLGSDMGDSVTGGGINGKDLSKADVSVNIICHNLAQEHNCIVTSFCAIGDVEVTFALEKGEKIILPYEQVVVKAMEYINSIGGFEKFAEWGLIRP